MKCLNCSKEFEGRKGAKYCSDRCKVAYNRNKTNNKRNTESKNVTDNVTLTKTDQTFYDRQIRDGIGDYYYFTADRHKRKCVHCNKDFITSLRLNKFCSYEHMSLELKTNPQ